MTIRQRYFFYIEQVYGIHRKICSLFAATKERSQGSFQTSDEDKAWIKKSQSQKNKKTHTSEVTLPPLCQQIYIYEQISELQNNKLRINIHIFLLKTKVI